MALRTWTDQQLIEACQEQNSIIKVIESLGLKYGGGTDKRIRKTINELGIDTSHFTRTSINGESLRRIDPFQNDVACNTNTKRRFLELVAYQCVLCYTSEWLGKPITLHMDHIDGDNRNNLLDNLRLLCPNCHQQTETWGVTKRHRKQSTIGE